jgi:hypothetical protein
LEVDVEAGDPSRFVDRRQDVAQQIEVFQVSKRTRVFTEPAQTGANSTGGSRLWRRAEALKVQ